MSPKILFATVLFLILPVLAGCGTISSDKTAFEEAVLSAPIDPGDEELVLAIQDYLTAQKGPKNSQYEYVRVDLNNDGLREGLVLFNLPHSYWCGWSGCTMAIFQAVDNEFQLLSQTTRIRGPLVVGQARTNGWEDIIVRLSGMDYADRNVRLTFNGQMYPDNPAAAEIVPYDLASIDGLRFFP